MGIQEDGNREIRTSGKASFGKSILFVVVLGVVAALLSGLTKPLLGANLSFLVIGAVFGIGFRWKDHKFEGKVMNLPLAVIDAVVTALIFMVIWMIMYNASAGLFVGLGAVGSHFLTSLLIGFRTKPDQPASDLSEPPTDQENKND